MMALVVYGHDGSKNKRIALLSSSLERSLQYVNVARPKELVRGYLHKSFYFLLSTIKLPCSSLGSSEASKSAITRNISTNIICPNFI